jgi:hypothetical protein
LLKNFQNLFKIPEQSCRHHYLLRYVYIYVIYKLMTMMRNLLCKPRVKRVKDYGLITNHGSNDTHIII